MNRNIGDVAMEKLKPQSGEDTLKITQSLYEKGGGLEDLHKKYQLIYADP